MTGLADKRVAVIGTGATSVQCVPHLAEACGELYVFQRTPSSVDVRANQPTDPEWFAEVRGAGWQERWIRNFTALQTGGFADDDLVGDGWTDIARRVRSADHGAAGRRRSPSRAAGGLRRLRLREDGRDPRAGRRGRRRPGDRRRRLKPWYRQLCKRPCFHDEYLQAYNRPSAHLVDTDGKGVERITETGRGRGGGRARGRLHHLRLGLRGGHRLHPAGRLRHGRARRRAAVRALGRGHAHAARHPRPRLPQRLRGAGGAGRQPHLQLPAQPHRGRPDGGHGRRPRPTRASRGRAHRRGRGRVGRDARRPRSGRAAHPTAPPATTTTRARTGGRPATSYVGYPDGPTAFFELIDAWRSAGDFEGLDLRRSTG